MATDVMEDKLKTIFIKTKSIPDISVKCTFILHIGGLVYTRRKMFY